MSTPKLDKSKVGDAKKRQFIPLATPSDLGAEATKEISGAMNAILADIYALYL